MKFLALALLAFTFASSAQACYAPNKIGKILEEAVKKDLADAHMSLSKIVDYREDGQTTYYVEFEYNFEDDGGPAVESGIARYGIDSGCKASPDPMNARELKKRR